jgi:hypothetical protein
MDEEPDYTARMDQRLAQMRDVARLTAAFYKSLLVEGVQMGEATQITAIYAVFLGTQSAEEDE